MEQYELSESDYYKNIRIVLDNFTPKHIFIRQPYSKGAKTMIRETLVDKEFDIKKTADGLLIIIDGEERFVYTITDNWSKRFCLAYIRDPLVFLPTGLNPDDESLSPVKESMIRGVNGDYLIEITFEGKIPLSIHSLKDKDRGCNIWKLKV